MLLKVWTGFSLDLRNLIILIVAAIHMLNFWSCNFFGLRRLPNTLSSCPFTSIWWSTRFGDQQSAPGKTRKNLNLQWRKPLNLRFSDQRNGSLRSYRFACPSPGCRRWVPSNWKEFLRETQAMRSPSLQMWQIEDTTSKQYPKILYFGYLESYRQRTAPGDDLESLPTAGEGNELTELCTLECDQSVLFVVKASFLLSMRQTF